jgi:hypothetical protein
MEQPPSAVWFFAHLTFPKTAFAGAALAAGLFFCATTLRAEEPPDAAALPTSVSAPPPGKGAPREAAVEDLSAFGYVEEEFLVSGKANVYDYDANGAVAVKTPGVDYTTRILVRRPADPGRFSGNVQVETSHPQYGIDFIWPRIADYVFANGDAYVSIAMRRGERSAIEFLKQFDPVRYEAVNFTEDGLNWDIIGQVGRLLKTQTDLNPLNGFPVERLYAQGWSGGGALLLITLSDGFHERARMPDGGPIFDAYLVGEPSGYPLINAAAERISDDDPRQKVGAADVPVITLHTRPQRAQRRRPDGDGPNDRYRVYEVAGAAHANVRLPSTRPLPEQVLGESPCAYDVSMFPLHHYFKSTLARLDAWAARGVVPPPSQRIALDEDGAPRLDEHGNPAGGVRSSYLDAPTARFFQNEAKPGGSFCAQLGAQEPFSPEKLAALYGDHDGYLRKAVSSLNALEQDGWILPADAEDLREEAAQFDGF